MLLSIITVCKNAEKEIRDTIVSVMEQNFTDYEYLIWDGVSEDGTLTVINETIEEYQGCGVPVQIVSEKDSGIYNAMNRAVLLTRGEWVLFLNAGDYLLHADVLRNTFGQICSSDADIIYGDWIVYYRSGIYDYQKPVGLKVIKEKMPFCHQSTISRRYLLEKFPFNEAEKICADYEFIIDCFQAKSKFLYCSGLICMFAEGGVSMLLRWDKMELQFINVSFRKGLLTQTEYEKRLKENNKLKRKMILFSVLKRVLPAFLVERMLRKRRISRGMKKNWEEVLTAVKKCG